MFTQVLIKYEMSKKSLSQKFIVDEYAVSLMVPYYLLICSVTISLFGCDDAEQRTVSTVVYSQIQSPLFDLLSAHKYRRTLISNCGTGHSCIYARRITQALLV